MEELYEWQYLGMGRKESNNGVEYDYSGDMSYFQRQLAKKGITKGMLDMDNYIGLTAAELQGIVDSANIVRKEGIA